MKSCGIVRIDFYRNVSKLLTLQLDFAILDKSLMWQAAVAQSVAHLIGSEEVTGSIPVSSWNKTN